MQLNWNTALEVNNDFFAIEHSTDGQSFLPIGSVSGNGNVTATTNYAYLHQEPANGDNFYRLKQVDFDGTYAYSPVQRVNFSLANEGIQFTATPNPTDGLISLRIAGELTTGSTITVLDLSGRELIRRVIIEQTNAPRIDLTQLPSGTYLIKLTSGKEVSLQRVVKR